MKLTASKHTRKTATNSEKNTSQKRRPLEGFSPVDPMVAAFSDFDNGLTSGLLMCFELLSIYDVDWWCLMNTNHWQPEECTYVLTQILLTDSGTWYQKVYLWYDYMNQMVKIL